MDENRFALVTKAIQHEATERRGAVKGVIGAALGLSLGRLAIGDASAKKKKKKKCPTCETCPTCPTCPAPCTGCSDGNDEEGRCDTECCLYFEESEGGFTFCRFTDEVCCPADKDSGSCPDDFPFCCGVSAENPDGLCSETAEGCEEAALRAATRNTKGYAPRIRRKR